MRKNTFAASALACCAGLAAPAATWAQEGGLTVSVGARVWQTEWTTFSYYTPVNTNLALTQAPAQSELVAVPTVIVRWGDFLASASTFPKKRFDFGGGSSGTREEFDANLGWTALPGLTLTAGWKVLEQRGGDKQQVLYKPKGPTLGIAATAPLGRAFSLYGTFAVGWLKTKKSSDPNIVQFDADYRLSDVGLAYTYDTQGTLIKRWTFTVGWRSQTLDSKNAFPESGRRVDGLDTTKGFAFGVFAVF